ncbi:MAG TPA: hypothetical protein VKQ71_05695, partial [Acidimicrobiales bacterium]|nr:hypothetical protein [Acidimicrobiales bacterium]
MAALAATAAAGTRTHAIIYEPFASSGAPAVRVTSTIQGHCWTGSLATPRRDAWRCMNANPPCLTGGAPCAGAASFIYDPCFSSAKAPGVVLCPAPGPWSDNALEIKLTSRLPTKFANTKSPTTTGLPWALVTMRGWRCGLNTGATTVVDHRRANYFCTGTRDWLWGGPSRRSQPWLIYAAPLSARRLHTRVGV